MEIWNIFCDRCSNVIRAFDIFEALLKKEFLPCESGTRVASPGEFMYMGEQDGTRGFKHIDTRRYIYVHEGKLNIPKDFDCTEY